MEHSDPRNYLDAIEQQAHVYKSALNDVAVVRLEVLAAVEASLDLDWERLNKILNGSKYSSRPPGFENLTVLGCEALALAVDLMSRLEDPKAAIAQLRREVINPETERG